MTDILKTLEERQKTHGNFSGHASISQALKGEAQRYVVLRGCTLSPDQWEAMEMIFHKIARIINGNPDCHDHWHDIAGYATLVANRLEVNHE